jgi:hypothetical protein
MDFYRILGILAFLALPLILHLVANSLKRKRYEELNAEINALTYCKICRENNYQVNHVHESLYYQSYQYMSDDSAHETKDTYTIICRNCNKIIGTKVFESRYSTGGMTLVDSLTTEETDIPIDGLVDRIKSVSAGCTEIFCRGISWVLIIGYIATIIYGLAIR